VASFVGERKAVQQYDARIQTAYKTGVKSRASSGLGLGTMIFVLYATYSLALWYGSRLIASHGYNGGEVLNVLMAVLIGGM
jgi:ATP-binding cassette subfamily B (MDR/TAP) protein 1